MSLLILLPPRYTLFPYTTLFRSLKWRSDMVDALLTFQPSVIRGNASEIGGLAGAQVESKGVDSTLDSTAVYAQAKSLLADRKSTRLNSSHVRISYAVFCLKKKLS